MVTGGHKEGKNEGKPETVRMPLILAIIQDQALVASKHYLVETGDKLEIEGGLVTFIFL